MNLQIRDDMPDLSMSTPLSLDALSSNLMLDTPGVDLWRARRHLLDTKDLTKVEVECALRFAAVCKKLCQLEIAPLPVLNSKVVANIFYENSTRTRSSFELAARRLGATVLNLDVQSSSVAKGETLLDTAQTLIAMGVHAIVQRHASSGSAHRLSEAFHDKVHVLNAGDGWNAHPTQGLLDLFTMLEVMPDLCGAKVAIVGDISHSRVARSNIWLLKLFGAHIHLAGPPTLMPPEISKLGVTVHNQLEPAIEDADFVIALRIQLERQKKGEIPSLSEYKKLYRLDHHRLKLAKPTARVLHPGPVNRGVELTDHLADDPELSLIRTQVANGVAVRMAVLYLLLASKEAKS
jgi:aspartate carbamoyltransferase catalytic subunit